jgi:hypothetical protein
MLHRFTPPIMPELSDIFLTPFDTIRFSLPQLWVTGDAQKFYQFCYLAFWKNPILICHIISNFIQFKNFIEMGMS